MKPKLRPFGDLLLELEERYNEAIFVHKVQLGDLVYNLFGWGQIHVDAQERYTSDNSTPELYYGPRRKRCTCCDGIKDDE